MLFLLEHTKNLIILGKEFFFFNLKITKIQLQFACSWMRFFRGTGKGDNQRIAQEVGVPLCDALVAYDAGDFATAVSLVNPLRYKIINIGGSHAQVKQLISVYHFLLH